MNPKIFTLSIVPIALLPLPHGCGDRAQGSQACLTPQLQLSLPRQHQAGAGQPGVADRSRSAAVTVTQECVGRREQEPRARTLGSQAPLGAGRSPGDPGIDTLGACVSAGWRQQFWPCSLSAPGTIRILKKPSLFLPGPRHPLEKGMFPARSSPESAFVTGYCVNPCLPHLKRCDLST